MSFTHALYYPWIDVRDPGWLKSAVLYWERISTIVPTSIARPYRSVEARTLQGAGVLLPIEIEPDMDEVDRASREIARCARRPEGVAVLLPPGAEVAEEHWSARDRHASTLLHPEKMSDELRYNLLETGQAQEAGKWLVVNRDFANGYMTVLAANLAQKRGLALLADEQRYEPLADLVRRGEAERAEVPDTRRMGEALLAHLALEVVNVTPDTSIEKVLGFREQHCDEIARFRQAVGRLADHVGDEASSLEAFQQEARDLYINNVQPAINDLKATLRAARIKSFVSYLKTLAFSSPLALLPAVALAPALGPFAAPVALFAGAGFSITVNLVNYRLDRQELLRENPYSYVLAAQRVFGTKRR